MGVHFLKPVSHGLTMIFYGGGKKPNVLHHHVVLVLLLGLSVFFAQCSGSNEPKKVRAVKARIKRELGGPELGNIRDKRHSVGNPSKRKAEASGIGCGSIQNRSSKRDGPHLRSLSRTT